jgi:hypothetical protein
VGHHLSTTVTTDRSSLLDFLHSDDAALVGEPHPCCSFCLLSYKLQALLLPLALRRSIKSVSRSWISAASWCAVPRTPSLPEWKRQSQCQRANFYGFVIFVAFLTQYGKKNSWSQVKSHTVSADQISTRGGENGDRYLAGVENGTLSSVYLRK